MKKKQIVLAFLIVAIISVLAVPLSRAAETVTKPTVTLPANWQQTDQTAYPDTYSEHDPAGAGMVEYTDQTDYDTVVIYYEKAQVSSYTSQQLKNEAEDLFESYDVSDNIGLDSSGVTQYAGVSAGFAKGYDIATDTYKMEIVFIKGNQYINVHAYYDATTEDQNQVESLTNSISVGGTAATAIVGNNMIWIIIGVVAAVIVIVVVIVVLRGRKKQPQQATMQKTYPPPPPPPPTQ